MNSLLNTDPNLWTPQQWYRYSKIVYQNGYIDGLLVGIVIGAIMITILSIIVKNVKVLASSEKFTGI